MTTNTNRKVKIKRYKSFEHKIKALVRKKKIQPKIIYKKAKCLYVDENGKSCKRNAVGKSQLCAKHGGDERIRDNYLTPLTEKLMPSIKPQAHLVPYDQEVHPMKMVSMSAEGLSEVEIAAELGVSLHRLKGWAEDYEVFSEAYDLGKALYESWWLRKGKSGLDDPRNFNTPLYKFLTGNKLGYSDKIENKNFNVSAGVLVVPSTPKSVSEWESNCIDVDTSDVDTSDV